jgi:hypothetical protein
MRPEGGRRVRGELGQQKLGGEAQVDDPGAAAESGHGIPVAEGVQQEDEGGTVQEGRQTLLDPLRGFRREDRLAIQIAVVAFANAEGRVAHQGVERLRRPIRVEFTGRNGIDPVAPVGFPAAVGEDQREKVDLILIGA